MCGCVGFAGFREPFEVIDDAEGDELDEVSIGSQRGGDGIDNATLLSGGGIGTVFGTELAEIGIGFVDAEAYDLRCAVGFAQAAGLREGGLNDELFAVHVIR